MFGLDAEPGGVAGRGVVGEEEVAQQRRPYRSIPSKDLKILRNSLKR